MNTKTQPLTAEERTLLKELTERDRKYREEVYAKIRYFVRSSFWEGMSEETQCVVILKKRKELVDILAALPEHLPEDDETDED